MQDMDMIQIHTQITHSTSMLYYQCVLGNTQVLLLSASHFYILMEYKTRAQCLFADALAKIWNVACVWNPHSCQTQIGCLCVCVWLSGHYVQCVPQGWVIRRNLSAHLMQLMCSRARDMDPTHQCAYTHTHFSLLHSVTTLSHFSVPPYLTHHAYSCSCCLLFFSPLLHNC